MRVWIDISNSPQVPFFRPLVALLRERGHDVDGDDARIRADRRAARAPRNPARGRRAGPRRRRGGWQGACDGGARPRAPEIREAPRVRHSRSRTRRTSSRSSRARSESRPRTRSTTSSRASQHGLGCRAARRVVVPDAIPQGRLDRLGARATKVRRYPGLKEEYYLHGFEPDGSVSTALGLDPRARARRRPHAARGLAVPPARQPALRRRARAARARRERPGRRPPAHRPSSAPGSRPRPPLARSCPEHAIDAQSLVALADLVVSAGGTMNREAVALGVPVYTTFAGGWAR